MLINLFWKGKISIKQNILISYLSFYGIYEGSFYAEYNKNSLLRIEQYRTYFDSKKSIDLAKEFIKGKILNMRTLLMRYNRKLEDSAIRKSIGLMKAEVNKLKNCKTKKEILGIEGISTKEYFKSFSKILKNPSFKFENRNRRPPKDEINALLSFAYTMLIKDIMSALYTIGFDPYIGFLHSSKYGRPALALDLMEEFRPIISDSTVFYLINKNIINFNTDFFKYNNACFLNEKGREKFYAEYEKRKSQIINHPVFKYKSNYRKNIELQARLLAKFLINDIARYYPFLVK